MFNVQQPPVMISKLSVPVKRGSLVLRPRLLNLLAEGNRRVLTLVCAPAGYGKTTLLVDWASICETPVCWLSLDEGDNDLTRFLAYLYESVKKILTVEQAEVCQVILEALLSNPSAEQELFLAALLNGMQQVLSPIMLVLDDYHVIQSQSIHQAVRFLLQNLPSNLHLAITSRTDPPLGLARLRVRDQICEIRMADLAFTPEEAAEFLNQRHALNLSAQEMAALEERTEGWVAGLQLAALAMKSPTLPQPADRSAFIQNMLSSQRHILEYLTEEVFNQQPEAIQTFLLCTSVLDRLCAPLCDALLQREEGRRSGKEAWIAFSIPASLNGQYFLDWLDSNQLFLIPLEAERRWYRYHSLFAGLLKGKLKQAHPGLAEILLGRAALWNEEQGYLSDAFAQALETKDVKLAASLFERHILTFFFQSEFKQVANLLSALPEAELHCRPLLCVVYAGAIALLPPYPPQSLVEAEKWMQVSEQVFSRDPTGSPLAQVFAWMIRSYWARFLEEPPETIIARIEQAMAFLPGESQGLTERNVLYIRSGLQTNLALTYWEMGDESAARTALVTARRVSSLCGDLFNEAAATDHLVKIFYYHGELHEAALLCREALKRFEIRKGPGVWSGQSAVHRTPFSGVIGIQLAEILIEQNELTEADQHLRENIDLARWTHSHGILLRGNLALARLAAASGDYSAAFNYLHDAEQLSEEGAGRAAAQRAGLWLALCANNEVYLDLARQWVNRCQKRIPLPVEFREGPPPMSWNFSLVYARLLIEEGNLKQLADLLLWLERQAGAMRQWGWAHWEIQLRLVEGMVYQKMGNIPAALAALKRAVELAGPGGYVRVFLDEGQPLQGFFHLLKEEPGRPLPALQKIRASIPETRAWPVHPTPAFQEGSLEPLTAREMEVLRLICQGYSNQEIADRLVVTLNTVKKHNYSIFQKLEVENRAQAILAAKRRGLG